MSFADELRNTRPESAEEKERQYLIRYSTNDIVRCVRNMCRAYAQAGKHRLAGFPVRYNSDGYYEDRWSKPDDPYYRMFFGTSAERRSAMAQESRKNSHYGIPADVLLRPTYTWEDHSTAETIRSNVARELGKDGFSSCSVTVLEGHNVQQRVREGFWGGGELHYSYTETPGTFYALHVDVSW